MNNNKGNSRLAFPQFYSTPSHKVLFHSFFFLSQSFFFHHIILALFLLDYPTSMTRITGLTG